MAQDAKRNEWYWHSIVNLHVDNHSRLVGKGHTVEELTEMVRGIDVPMIQVSALGADGVATIPTKVCPRDDLDGWDTLAVWKQVAGNLDRKFGVYINTRGLSLHKKHPGWMQRDAKGKGKGRPPLGLDICMRPSADGSGALEAYFLPLLRDIAKYDPDALWVDGDHARTPVCYCPNCKAAWQARTGKPEPPTHPDDPDWPAWTTLEQERVDAYRKQMADLLHELCPKCMYTSNHSWRFRERDPRDAPPYADTLSGDLSHGDALGWTRTCAMQLAPEERVPYDIMHNYMSIAGAPATLPRILQQGALTLACGGQWFLWSPGSAIVKKPIRTRAALCAEFAQKRRTALGRSTSGNQVAVLLSETSWCAKRIHGEPAAYGEAAAKAVALALQDAAFCVDMPNEDILRARLPDYRTVVIVNQRVLAQETVAALRAFARDGGQVIVMGSGLADNAEATGFLGCKRTEARDDPAYVELDDEFAVFPASFRLAPASAEVLVRFRDGEPFLTRQRAGRGWAACVAATPSYPDEDGLMGWLMRVLGNGPSVHVDGPARDEHLVFSLRRKPGQVILHVTDLTSRVAKQRVWPSSSNDIDDANRLGLKLSLPMPVQPQAASIAPTSASVSQRWADGVLQLTLRDFSVHAAVVIDVAAPEALPYMADSTPRAAPRRQLQVTEQTFEKIRLGGDLPEAVGKAKAAGSTAIRVTASMAASGRRSLMFIDSDNASQPFYPYLTMQPRGLNRGIGYVSLDLRIDGQADVHVELRENENAKRFPVGPSLSFTSEHGLRAQGVAKPLASLPANKWCHVDIVCPLRRGAKYEIRLRVPGRKEQRFTNLAFAKPDFWRCGWIGIIGMGTKNATFYVDNLRFGRLRKGEGIPKPKAAVSAVATPPRLVSEPGLVAYWRFDEGDGDATADSSGSGCDGDVNAEWVAGRVGKALSFSGRRGHNVQVEDNPALRFGTSSFSISCWLKPETLDGPKGYRRLIEKAGFPNSWWNIDIQRDGRVQMEMGDAKGRPGTTTSTGSIASGKWLHLAVVVDRAAATTTYYFNGMRDSARPIPAEFAAALDVPGKPLVLGAQTWPFIGDLDEVRIHKRPLSVSEVKAFAEPH